MKKIVYALFCICFSMSAAHGQATDTAFVSRLVNNLKNYSAGHIQEKAYLQFDKPYYAASDTMYFKAYVTAGDEHKLSNLSGVLHVDLIDPNNNIEHFILLQLVNGIGWGDLTLADTLAPGNYRVRAYTKYMQPDEYFDQQFVIGSAKRNVVSESAIPPPNNGIADVQFFPEGGNLVTDIRTRVAFKAVGTDGLGTAVKGIVTDNFNNTITTFGSGFAGMGSFTLLPEQGRTYKVKYKLKDSIVHIVDLPAIQNKGILLSASTADADNLNITILANPAYYRDNHDKNVLVSVYAGGKFTYVRSKLDSYELDLQLPVSKFRSGVARVTLFDQAGDPLSERLVFIKNQTTDVAPAITIDKAAYDKREKVSVDLLNKNIAPDRSGHYSVSVINESKLPGATYPNSIYAYLLLTSELKGHIEKPDHYFDDNSDKARADLNVLMLAQGYRKFSWKQVADGISADKKNSPERSLIISGTVKTLNDKKPVNNGTVNLISPVGGPLLTTQTDSNGRFRFQGLIANDTTRLMLSATSIKGRPNTLIHVDSYPEEEKVSLLRVPGDNAPDMQTYLQNKVLQMNADLTYDLKKSKLLKEVKVKALRSANLAGAGHADQALDLSNNTVGGQLPDILTGRLRGVNFLNNRAYLNAFHTGPMLLVVDGVVFDTPLDTLGNALSPTDLSSINPSDVETVEVLKYANASIYGVSAGNGVLIITTKQGSDHTFSTGSATGILSFRPNGFYLAREFYSPKYLPGFASAKPDLRSTIYWLPDIKTDEAGKASFSYYNADGTGNYRMTVEGVDNNGNIAHSVYRYAVK